MVIPWTAAPVYHASSEYMPNSSVLKFLTYLLFKVDCLVAKKSDFEWKGDKLSSGKIIIQVLAPWAPTRQ